MSKLATLVASTILISSAVAMPVQAAETDSVAPTISVMVLPQKSTPIPRSRSKNPSAAVDQAQRKRSKSWIRGQ